MYMTVLLRQKDVCIEVFQDCAGIPGLSLGDRLQRILRGISESDRKRQMDMKKEPASGRPQEDQVLVCINSALLRCILRSQRSRPGGTNSRPSGRFV